MIWEVGIYFLKEEEIELTSTIRAKCTREKKE
jgi:hypothetical protein